MSLNQLKKTWRKIKTTSKLRPFFQWFFHVLNHIEESYVNTRRRKYQKRIKYLQNAPRVLVMASRGGIGNLVETTPLIQAIRILWPQSHITILTSAADLLLNWSVPDEICSNPLQIQSRQFDHTFFPYWGWKGIPDTPLDCQTGAIHCPKLFHNKWFTKPERQVNVDMLGPLGYRGPIPPLYVSMTPKPEFKFEHNLKFCIAAGGKNTEQWRNKRWPFYDQLCLEILSAYPQAGIYFIGTQEDAFPESLQDNSRIYDLRGCFSLSQTAWFLKQSDFVIGNDCGPMHIADAVQASGIVLFGPTCELKNGPYYKIRVLSSGVECRPCQFLNTMKCQQNDCIKLLTVDKVMLHIKSYSFFTESKTC